MSPFGYVSVSHITQDFVDELFHFRFNLKVLLRVHKIEDRVSNFINHEIEIVFFFVLTKEKYM